MEEYTLMEGKDHDILIKVAANLEGLKGNVANLCKQINSVDSNNRTEHKDIKTMIDDLSAKTSTAETSYQKDAKVQIDKCNSKFLQTKVFLWVAGFIIAGIVGAYSFTSYVQADLSKHKIQDAKVMTEFQKQVDEIR